MLYASLAGTFILSEEAVANSPTRLAGVSDQLEAQLRLYGCELIQEAGCLLKLPQAVMATGQVLLHRFYGKRSMTEHDVKDVACASLFLASKLEEQQKRARDVVNVFHRLDQRRQGLTPEGFSLASERYAAAKKHLVDTERAMLRELGFILHVDHPHKTVLNYLSNAILDAEDLMQEAWNLTNDSLRTTLCIQMRGEAIACGIIFMAARRLQVPLPEQPPWWELFDVTQAELAKVARTMAALYSQPKAQYVAVKQGHTPQGLTSPGASPAMANGASEVPNGVASSQAHAGDTSPERASSPAERQTKDSASLEHASKRSRGSEDRTGSGAGRRSPSRSGSPSRSRSGSDRKRSASASPRRKRSRSATRSRKRSRSASPGAKRSRSGSPRRKRSRSRSGSHGRKRSRSESSSTTDSELARPAASQARPPDRLPDPPARPERSDRSERPSSGRARGESAHAHARPEASHRHQEAQHGSHRSLSGHRERHRDSHRDRLPEPPRDRHRHRHRDAPREGRREHDPDHGRRRDRDVHRDRGRDVSRHSKAARTEQRQQAWAARQAREAGSGRTGSGRAAGSPESERRHRRSPHEVLPGPPAEGPPLDPAAEADLYEASRHRIASQAVLRAKEL